MAQVIEFYVPANHPFQWQWTTDERGKLIAFPNTNPELSSLTQREDERGKLIAFPNTNPELSSLTQREAEVVPLCVTVAHMTSSQMMLAWVAE